MKTCTRCGNPKNIKDFHRDRTTRDGRSAACKLCRNIYNQSDTHKMYGPRLRDIIFDHYGRECIYCGATDNLQCDHVNGDGKQHKRNKPKWHREIIAAGFPADCQVLCKQCNTAKQDMTDQQFRQWIARLHHRLNSL